MNAVAGLVSSDTRRHRDLGEQGGGFGGVVHAGEADECGAEVDAAKGQRRPDLVAGDRVGVGGENHVDVLANRLRLIAVGAQHRGGTLYPLAVGRGRHCEADGAVGFGRRNGGDLGALVEQEQLLELDVADVRTVGEDLLRRRQ